MADPNQLAGSTWRPIEIAGEAIPDNAGVFVRFEEGGKIAAHGGCNRMAGSYRIDGTTVRVGPLVATGKGCSPEIMARENAFGEALGAARIFLRDGAKLTLKSAQGQTAMRLVSTEWN